MDEQEKGQRIICPSSVSLANADFITTRNDATENPVYPATLNASIAKNNATGFDNLQVTQSALGADGICGQYTNGGSQVNVAPAEIVPPVTSEKYPWPPGFAGNIAQFIYYSSYLPVREVSIAATLGLLAGVCGRAFTISGKSASLYIILVARSGIGKDGMHEAIHKMIEMAQVPMAERFINASDFASGPALHKAILKQPGFLNLQGEFGRKLKRMANPRDTPMQDLRTVMTDAFAKRKLDGKSYSDSEKTMLGVAWPALSFLGETTPITFYEALTPDMLADGFMSRFLVISYDGERPLSNEARAFKLEPDELEKWRAIIVRAIPYQQVMNSLPPIEVEYANTDAYDKLQMFELRCGKEVNASGSDESKRQMWSRAHLKALQIASLLAIADNEVFPQINLGHATWAITVVRNDIDVFKAKLDSGDIGSDDHSRETKLLSLMVKYIREKPSASYKIHPDMLVKGAIPRKYFQRNVSSATAFNNHKLGAAAALDSTIRSLMDSGYLAEIPKAKIPPEWGAQGKCFWIQNLAD